MTQTRTNKGLAAELVYESLEFDTRYYVQTAKSHIVSLAQVVGEAVSNSDEAIQRRLEQSDDTAAGRIDLYYDPETHTLRIKDDGKGLTAPEMDERLKRVGAKPDEGAKRGFFHRGIREVFLALGGGKFTSVARHDKSLVLTEATFDPALGIAYLKRDVPVTDTVLAELGLRGPGSIVEVSLSRLARERPRSFEFGQVEVQIRDCVQVRPVLTDPNREVSLHYGSAPPRRLRYQYPAGDELLAPQSVTVMGHKATIWARVAEEPLSQGVSKLTRCSGILIRGERAAYEVTAGANLGQNSSMRRVFGELRLDAIEDIQRENDRQADEDAQLLYKADRTGLNPEHPLAEAVYRFIDSSLGPLVAGIEEKKQARTAPDVRRQLQRLARLINDVVREADYGEEESRDGVKSDRSQRPGRAQNPPGQSGADLVRVVPDGVAFERRRLLMKVEERRSVAIWFDPEKVPPGTSINLIQQPDKLLRSAVLSQETVPEPDSDGISTVNCVVAVGAGEGRRDLKVEAGGYVDAISVHVRYPRASGFISRIVPDERDWPSGSALYDPQSGEVRVYVGRPEFRSMADRVTGASSKNPWEHAMYRLLVVESVREAALREAAKRRAEIEWDDLAEEERRDKAAMDNLVQTQYFELDYKLRNRLLEAYLEGAL